jgi:hypothetical protein
MINFSRIIIKLKQYWMQFSFKTQIKGNNSKIGENSVNTYPRVYTIKTGINNP